MKKRLLMFSLFVLPIVAMEEGEQRRSYPPGALHVRETVSSPQLNLAMRMRSMAEQRDVHFSEMDGVVARLIAKNWEVFQQVTAGGNASKGSEQLLKKMVQDLKPLVANMVQGMVESRLSRSSDADKSEIVRGLLAEDGSEVQLAVQRQLERVVNILSMARKMYVAEMASPPSER